MRWAPNARCRRRVKLALRGDDRGGDAAPLAAELAGLPSGQEDDILPTGTRIRAGSKLFVSPYVVQRDPAYFPDPERLDPERFSEEGSQGRPSTRTSHTAQAPAAVSDSRWRLGMHACVGPHDTAGRPQARRRAAALHRSVPALRLWSSNASESPGMNSRNVGFVCSACSRSPSAASIAERSTDLWVDTLGLVQTSEFRNETENVDGEIAQIGAGPRRRPQPPRTDRPERSPRATGLPSTTSVFGSMTSKPPSDRRGGRHQLHGAWHSPWRRRLRRHFIDPKAGGEGVLIELVQAPPEVIEFAERAEREGSGASTRSLDRPSSVTSSRAGTGWSPRQPLAYAVLAARFIAGRPRFFAVRPGSGRRTRSSRAAARLGSRPSWRRAPGGLWPRAQPLPPLAGTCRVRVRRSRAVGRSGRPRSRRSASRQPRGVPDCRRVQGPLRDKARLDDAGHPHRPRTQSAVQVHLAVRSGGSRSPGTPVLMDLASSALAASAPDSCRCVGRRRVAQGALGDPGAGAGPSAQVPSFGARPERWFSQVDPAAPELDRLPLERARNPLGARAAGVRCRARSTSRSTTLARSPLDGPRQEQRRHAVPVHLPKLGGAAQPGGSRQRHGPGGRPAPDRRRADHQRPAGGDSTLGRECIAALRDAWRLGRGYGCLAPTAADDVTCSRTCRQ